MSVNLFLILASLANPAPGPMELLNKLGGSKWYTTLALPDKYEHIINGYRKASDGTIVGSGTAQAIGEAPITLSSKFSPTKDPSVVAYADRQGTTKLKGTVRRDGDKLILLYGAEGGREDSVKEVLMFANADRSVDGEVYSGGKLVLTYRMSRVATPDPVPALEGLDPVLLVKGTQQKGKESLTSDFEGFRYAFSSPETKRQFDLTPEPFAAQFGGACMNMGPLSGRGQPHLYEIYKEQLFLFASEGCRKSFLTNPDAFIDRPDTGFQVKPADLTPAIALLDKASMAHGDVDKMGSILRVKNSTYEQSGKTSRFDVATWSNLRDTFADVQAWDGNTAVTFLSPKSSWAGTIPKPSSFSAKEQDYFRRVNMRDIFAILRNRRTAGFVAEVLSPSDVGDLKGQITIRTHFRGSTATVYLNPSNHEVTAVKHRGRLIQENSDLTRVFGDVREVGGFRVPFEMTTVTGDGMKTTTKYNSIKVNEPIDLLPVTNPLSR